MDFIKCITVLQLFFLIFTFVFYSLPLNCFFMNLSVKCFKTFLWLKIVLHIFIFFFLTKFNACCQEISVAYRQMVSYWDVLLYWGWSTYIIECEKKKKKTGGIINSLNFLVGMLHFKRAWCLNEVLCSKEKRFSKIMC